MTHKDTELDTQELREQIYDWCYDLKHSLWTAEPDRTVNKLLALIAQREQAAELRGRVDELNLVNHFGGIGTEVDVFGYTEREYKDRLATLQATKPKKGTGNV